VIQKPESPPGAPAEAPSASAGPGSSDQGLVVPAGSGSFGSRTGGHADEPTRVSDSRFARDSNAPHIAERPTIEGYEIHEELHRGGQGVVYRATQLGTKRPVALKVLLEGELASETTRRRFEREVELAASLRHPYVVTILGSGASRGRMYFAMEYVEGVRLDHYLQQHQHSLIQTIELLEKICDAVNFAHQRGVIHRDLKPSNILIVDESHGTTGRLATDGGAFATTRQDSGSTSAFFAPHPKVLDFGLAKVERSTDPRETTVQALSVTGQVVGTLAYMSPEQAAGADSVDVRSDVYSLGVIFYESLLGSTPYPVTGALGEVLNRISKDDPIRPRSVRLGSRFGKQVDDELETILLKTLEKDPARRYQTAGDLGRDLRHYVAGEPIEAKRASGLYMLKKTLKRYRIQAAAAGIVLFMMVFSLFLLAGWYRSEKSARTEAERLRLLAGVEAERARDAAQAENEAKQRESQARLSAEEDKRRAERAADGLRKALVRQKIQRGELAQSRGDMAEARESYWDAYDDFPDSPAAQWQLRQYYSQSGDVGASQLYYRSFGPTAISSDGKLAAACDAPRAITVRRVDDLVSLAFLPAPGDVRLLNIDTAGRVVAMGADWMCSWQAGSEPRSVVAISDLVEPQSVHLVYDGQVAIIVDRRTVRTYDTVRGDLIHSHRLQADVAGHAAASETLQEIAVPTIAGVERLRVLENGCFASDLSWSGDKQRSARAVRYVGPDKLAVLSDGVDLLDLGDASDNHWERVALLGQEFERFDATPDGKIIAAATRDGRFAIFENGRQVDGGRTLQSTPLALWFPAGVRELRTLDDRGTVTRWSPDARRQQRRQLHNRPALRWLESDDGSTLLFVDADGRVMVVSPERSPTATPVVLPSIMGMMTSRTALDTLLAISADGERVVAAQENRLWLKTRGRPRATAIRWSSSVTPLLKDIAMSGDGSLLALLSQNQRGDRQSLSFQSAEPAAPGGRSPPTVSTIEFGGSPVRFIRFIPGTRRLLLARASGELAVIDTEADALVAGNADAAAAHAMFEEPWNVLDAGAYRAEFDRAGRAVALACDDGTVRVINLLDVSERAQFRVHREVNALSFNAAGTALLVRAADSAVTLFDVDTEERIAELGEHAAIGTHLGAWIGDGDSIVLSESDGLYETLQRSADDAIRAGGAFARQRHLIRKIDENDLAAAWIEAGKLRETNEALGYDAQVAVAEIALRRTRVEPTAGWVDTVLIDATPQSRLRLGHAAYEGGRFEIAWNCLRQAGAQSDGTLDPRSARRLAACEYLLGDAGVAADLLGDLLSRSTFARADIAQVSVERLLALSFAGRVSAARTVVGQLETQARSGQALPGMPTAVMLGKLLLDQHSDEKMSQVSKMLLANVVDQFPETRDDIEFFAAEQARARGDLDAARGRYQRCIDLAVDAWPANWAQFRLKQLSGR
jgi:serine/threonine protein kinase/WD40 repeat protein